MFFTDQSVAIQSQIEGGGVKYIPFGLGGAFCIV